MAKYIDKAAVVAEIYKLKKSHDNWSCMGRSFHRDYETLLSFLNTLEVKEVDLEKELIEWHKEHFKKDGTFIGRSGFYLTNNSQMDIAKHFYLLGLAQKGD